MDQVKIQQNQSQIHLLLPRERRTQIDSVINELNAIYDYQRNIITTIKKHGLEIFYTDQFIGRHGESVIGALVYEKTKGDSIFINIKNKTYNNLFKIVHSFGHYRLGHNSEGAIIPLHGDNNVYSRIDLPADTENTNLSQRERDAISKEEIEADYFTAISLLTEDTIVYYKNNGTLKDLTEATTIPLGLLEARYQWIQEERYGG